VKKLFIFLFLFWNIFSIKGFCQSNMNPQQTVKYSAAEMVAKLEKEVAKFELEQKKATTALNEQIKGIIAEYEAARKANEEKETNKQEQSKEQGRKEESRQEN